MLQRAFVGINKRSAKAYKNIAGMFTLKLVNIGVGLIIVPLTLEYLDTTRYGIWITLSAIFNWFSLFDIGFGNGLRNRLSEALANNEIHKARVYISVTYASLIIIFSVVFLLFIIANNFIDWTAILNTAPELGKELRLLAAVVFFFFCVRFVTQIITSVAFAKQEPAFSQFLEVIGRFASLIGIYLLTLYTKGSLLYLGITLTALPVFVLIFLSIYIFNGRYKELKPSIFLLHFKELNHIIGLGIKFFIIQIAGIIIYQTNNIIIAQFYGPSEVTPYAITYQYLALLNLAFIIILAPFWSAFTEAYSKGEINWIKDEIIKLKYIWIVMSFLMFIALIMSKFFIALWVGPEIEVNMRLAFTIALYLILLSYLGINCTFLNGIGKIKIQLYITIFFSLIHIPLAIYFCKKYGIEGVMFSSILSLLVASVIYEIQYHKLIAGKAKGLWNA